MLSPKASSEAGTAEIKTIPEQQSEHQEPPSKLKPPDDSCKDSPAKPVAFPKIKIEASSPSAALKSDSDKTSVAEN